MDRSGDRPDSIGSSSSSTELDTFNDPEKYAGKDSEDGKFNLKTPEELEEGVESEGLLPSEDDKLPEIPPTSTTRSSIIWMVVNTLATIGIVRSSRKIFYCY